MVALKRDDSVRERLLAAADELFYEEGVHTVGIDRILERANVAKASLYGTFGSKEDLVVAYLTRRSEQRQAEIAEAHARCSSPREKVLAVFDRLNSRVKESQFRGCAFVNASVEGPRGPTPIRMAAAKHRAWVRSMFEELAREMNVADPRALAVQLTILYDGAVAGSLMDAAPQTAAHGRHLATLLLDATERGPTPAPKKARPKPRSRAVLP